MSANTLDIRRVETGAIKHHTTSKVVSGAVVVTTSMVKT